MNDAIRAAKRLYLDANCLIYLIEREDTLQKQIANLVAYAVQNGIELAISEIGVAECLYGAFKRNSALLESLYTEIYYDVPLFMLCPVDGERLKLAAKLGAEKRLKLVDAVHLLAATEHECDVFVTNDTGFKSSHSIHVIQLSQL